MTKLVLAFKFRNFGFEKLLVWHIARWTYINIDNNTTPVPKTIISHHVHQTQFLIKGTANYEFWVKNSTLPFT